MTSTSAGPSATSPGRLKTWRRGHATAARGDQRPGHVLRVLEQRRPAEGDGVGQAEDRGNHGLGRAARHALVTAHAIHGHRTQADAGHPVVEPVHAGVALVGHLVHAVVSPRMTGGLDGQPARGRVCVVVRERSDRARVDERRHAGAATLDGLEHVHCAEDVDHRAEGRIRPTEGHLQRGEVDDVRDPVAVDDRLDRGEVGDVAGLERHALELLGRHDQAQPSRVAAEVESDDGGALTGESPHRPRADTAECPRDEEAFAAAGHETATLAGSKRQVFVSRPIRSISMVTSSPSVSRTGGSRKIPTPPGVPVAMTSPGSRVNACEQ